MNTPSILSAQYQNVLTSPDQLASIRGSGQYTSNYPMSSNWPIPEKSANSEKSEKSENSQNQFSDYAKKTTEVIPTYGNTWNLSSASPVGNRRNDEWVYTKDQTSFPPNANLEGDPYLQYGLKANQSVATALNVLFFNQKNVQYLQKRINDDIFNLTSIRIKPQSEDALLVIMNNKYQYSLYGYLPSSPVHLALPRGEKPCSLTGRLTRLNQSVLQDVIQQILSGMNMYLQYYKDASSMPTPLSLPTKITMKGSKALSENIGLESGNSRSLSSFNMRDNIIN